MTDSQNPEFTIDSHGMLRQADGKPAITPVDGALAQIHSFKSHDALILRLYLTTDYRHGRSAPDDDRCAPGAVHQFGMTAATARRVQALLSAFLAEAEGKSAPLQ